MDRQREKRKRERGDGRTESSGGGEGRGSGTVSEEMFFKIPSEIKSQKALYAKIKQSVKNAADSSGQIQKKSKYQKIKIIYMF